MTEDTARSKLHERLASKDRDEWIDEDGDDTLPVFVVSERAKKFHKRYGGCTDPSEANVGFDLFAAKINGYEPCQRCFADDPHVTTAAESYTDTEPDSETTADQEGRR